MRLLKTIASALAILAATIVLLEIVGHVVIPKEYLTLIRDVDHRIKPFADKDINEDGLRFHGSSMDLENKQVVLFLGDSFTYGYRLRYNETIPLQFEQLANSKGAAITSVNAGWISSSPILEERMLYDVGKKYHPQTVILLLDMTDIWDDNIYSQFIAGNFITRLGKYLPSTAVVIYKLLGLNNTLYQTTFGLPRNRFFHSNRPAWQSKPLFADTFAALNRIAAYTHDQLHANFMLVIIPRQYQYSDREAPDDQDRDSTEFRHQDLGPYVEEPFRIFNDYRKIVNFPVISLLDDFKHSNVFPTTFSNDAHLNPDGAHLAAQAIYTHCQVLHCLKK